MQQPGDAAQQIANGAREILTAYPLAAGLTPVADGESLRLEVLRTSAGEEGLGALKERAGKVEAHQSPAGSTPGGQRSREHQRATPGAAQLLQNLRIGRTVVVEKAGGAAATGGWRNPMRPRTTPSSSRRRGDAFHTRGTIDPTHVGQARLWWGGGDALRR